MHKLRKAISKGYTVLEMYKLWECEMVKFDRVGGSVLFTEYIDKFLKIKQEASSYSTWSVTEEEKEWYVEEILTMKGS